MVMMAPWMSTSRKSSGMAVISFDFSAQATCPNDRPNSLAHTLTECNAPKPFLRSWLRRAVLPSTAKIGCSMPVASAAAAAQRLQPGGEAGLKRRRVEQRQHPPKDILARHAVGQVENPAQERLL